MPITDVGYFQENNAKLLEHTEIYQTKMTNNKSTQKDQTSAKATQISSQRLAINDF